MRILFLSPRQCWPTTTGARLREFHLARQLAERAEVTMLSFADASMAEGLPFCREVVTVPPPPRYGVGTLVRGAIGSTPVSILNYTSKPMRAALRALLDREQFDAVQLEGTVMDGYAGMIASHRDAPAMVYNWHNIETELMHRYAARSRHWPKRLYARLTAHRLEAVETAMLRSDAAHIVCSEREKAHLLRMVPGAFVETVNNGVDVRGFTDEALAAAREYHRPVNGGEAPARRLVFAGSMNYYANVEGAIHFVRKIWPVISTEFADIQLTLLGSNPAPSVRALDAIERVDVSGTVPDTRPYYAQAAVAIVPLMTGGGTRLKILEAMAAGVPVVSSSIGAEGLHLAAGEDILIADSDEEWCAAIRKLLTDTPFARRMAVRGREHVARHYDWDIAGAALYATYEKLLARRSA
ncbi:MAG: glycosyltransferase [bacterium]